MNAGILRHRPVFESPTTSQDPNSGAEIKLWPPDGGVSLTLPADWQYLGTREFPLREKLYEQTNARAIVRYSQLALTIQPAITRAIHDGKEWDVNGVMPDSVHSQIIIEVSEVK
jgi:hypothetical protein